MSEEDQKKLKWGDFIRIHGVHQNKEKQEESKGLIISKGFTDPNIYYQKYSQFANINFYRESLFQVMPRSNFDVHDQLLDSTLTPQQREATKKRAEAEITGLYNTLRLKAGEKVLYGNEVVLRQVESNSYLKGVMKAADTGDGAFTIEVSEDLSSQILWKIRSHRSYQHDGDDIYFDDELLIYHEWSDCFMNFADNDKAIGLDTEHELKELAAEDTESWSYVQSRPSIKKPNEKRISIINENKSKCYWKFIEHCDYHTSNLKDKIKSHDIVYFQHTKHKGLISSALSSPKYFLKENSNLEQEPTQSYQCFWELIPKDVNELGPENCNDFNARNIVTGRLLDYQGQQVLIRSKEEVEGGGFKSFGLVNLICTEDGRKLERGKEIPRNQSKTQIIKKYEEKLNLFELIDVLELTEDSFQIVKVDEETMRNIQYIISAHEPLIKFLEVFKSQLKINVTSKQVKDNSGDITIIKEERYQFIAMNTDVLSNVKNILELLAGKIYATRYDQITSSGNTANPMIQKVLVESGMVELIIEIIYQLYDSFVNIEIYTEASEDRAQKNKIAEIFQRAYKLLQKIVVDNQDNKIYLSRWVDLFLKHSKNINREYIQECLVGILQNNPDSIELTINKDKIITLIESFFKEAANLRSGEELTTKYVRLFSTFIKCEDRVIKENQNIILNYFFKSMDNLWSFKIKAIEKDADECVAEKDDEFAKIRNRRVDIAIGNDYCSIPKYFKDWNGRWNYFLAYFNLLADVCMNRNLESIQDVSALVQLPIIASILLDRDIAHLNEEIQKENQQVFKAKGILKYPIENVHEPFIRIAHFVYIKNNKFEEITRIKNISNWYRHQGEERGNIRLEEVTITKHQFEGEKEEDEYYHLRSILRYIEIFVEKSDQKTCNLNILFTVLSLLKETIILGLWVSIKQYRKLIPLLIMRITKIENFKFFSTDQDSRKRFTAGEIVIKNKESLSRNRPEIASNIKCKRISTDIFKFMNELEIDIRLRYMMNFFKGLYEATESFEDYNKIEMEGKIEQPLAEKRNDQAKEEFLKSDFDSILGGDVKKISEDQDIMLKENIWYNKFKELTPFQNTSNLDDPTKNRYLFQGNQQEIDKHNPNFENQQKFDAMVLALFELPVYHNHDLLSSSLKMLRSIFEQRKDLIQNFKSILVCGKGNLQEVYLALKGMSAKFDMLADYNFVKIKSQEESDLRHQIYKVYDGNEKIIEKRSGILQDLFFLSRTLKEDVNLKNIDQLMRVEESMFDPQKVYNNLNEKQKNNKLFQSVNIAQGIYKPLMSYIKIIGNNPIPAQVHRKILFAIYQYLTLLCFNNLEAKQILMEYIPDVLPHLKLKVGAANFIYQVSINNKLLISNEDMVRLIIDGALDACIELDHSEMFEHILMKEADKGLILFNNYEKSQILFALRGVLILNDNGYRINQELLMNRFQDNKYKRLIYKRKVEFNSRRENFELNQEESYVAAHFELFSMMVESKNFINIGKLQNIHKYEYCLECLKNTNRWQIRRAIRAYINRLYYVNKDRDIFLFQHFIRKEFKIINDELEDLIILHRNKLINDEVIIPNGIRFKFAMSEIFQMIIEIFITIQEMLLKPEFIKILKREIQKEEKKSENQREIHDQFIKLLQHLGCLNKLYASKSIINSFIKENFGHIKQVMMNFNEKYLEKQSKQEGEVQVDENDDLGREEQKKAYVYDHSKTFFRNLNTMIRDIKAKDRREEMKKLNANRRNLDASNTDDLKSMFIDIIFSVQSETLKPIISKKFREVSSSLYKPHIQTANSRIFKVIAKPTLTENEENIELNRRLTVVKEIIEESSVFRKLREDEFFKLVVTLTKIDETSKVYYEKQWLVLGEKKSTPVVCLKEIFTNSFQLIMNQPDKIQDSQKIFIIKLARCYITEAVEGKQSYKLSVEKWEADYYAGNEPADQTEEDIQFIRRQNMIEECGGSQFINSIFSDNSKKLHAKIQLLNQTLLLGIAYLFNGNSDCQKSLNSVLTKDQDNAMLLEVKRLINTIGNFLIEIRKIKEQGKMRKFNYSIVDTYDFFNIRDNQIVKQFGNTGLDKFQIRQELAREDAICRIFRFLQLLCENGNIENKKFLLQQTNEAANEGEEKPKKTNSINFIEETTLLLRKLFKIMNNKVVKIPNTLINFIAEITQMPCLNNQIALLKSTFFEDLSYLADFFLTIDNVTNRKFNFIPQRDDEPIVLLRDIYLQGIELALCNFQGNDNILFWEFLSKCQPKFLWIVIKQNLVVLLQEKAEEYGIVKSEDDYNEEQFTSELLQKFNSLTISDYIAEQRRSSPLLRSEIENILKVLYILKKLEVYAQARKEEAELDKDNINHEENNKALKAFNFKVQLIEFAKKQYRYIVEFLDSFEDLILSIEVSAENGKTQSFQFIYFPKHPVFAELSNETRDDIMMIVKRDTQRDKQITLLETYKVVEAEIELNYQLKFGSEPIPYLNRPIPFPLTSEFASEVRNKARSISYLICALMLMLILVDHDLEEQISIFTYDSFLSEVILRIFATAQLFYTLWFTFIWLKLRLPLVLKRFYKEYEEQLLKQMMEKVAKDEEKNRPDSEKEGWDLLLSWLKRFKESWTPYFQQIKHSLLYNRVIKNSLVAFVALSRYESGFMSIIIFIIASFFGNFVGVEWYTIHLFDILASQPSLSNIFKAILNNFQKLALLSVLAGVFILVFNVISLNTYTPVIWQDDFPDESCQQIVGCVLELYTSGAIGDDMDEFYGYRFIFDIVNVVFMEMLFQNIVGGIIIDAFAELKEQDQERDDDKKDNCYVCAMTKSDIETSRSTFVKHTAKHFLWNYLFYLFCLKQKSSTDYTGLEFDIYEKRRSEDVSWFPAMGADDSEGDVEAVMTELETKLKQLSADCNATLDKSSATMTTALEIIGKIKGQ